MILYFLKNHIIKIKNKIIAQIKNNKIGKIILDIVYFLKSLKIKEFLKYC